MCYLIAGRIIAIVHPTINQTTPPAAITLRFTTDLSAILSVLWAAIASSSTSAVECAAAQLNPSFNAEFLVFNAEFLVFNAEFMIFTHLISRQVVSSSNAACVST